jgi:hypothetical protein
MTVEIEYQDSLGVAAMNVVISHTAGENCFSVAGFGYLCQHCGCWVQYGYSHVCPNSYPYYYPWPETPPSDEICPDCGEVIERCPTCGKIKKEK